MTIQKLSEYKITSRDGSFINVECNTKIINTLVRKINTLVDAVNELQATISKMEKVAENGNFAKNAQDRMIGCTTLDIPESYKNDQLTLATLDYNKKLEKENRYLKDKLEHITDILYESKYALEEVINPSCISHEQEMAQEALDKVNTEIKAIKGE